MCEPFQRSLGGVNTFVTINPQLPRFQAAQGLVVGCPGDWKSLFSEFGILPLRHLRWKDRR